MIMMSCSVNQADVSSSSPPPVPTAGVASVGQFLPESVSVTYRLFQVEHKSMVRHSPRITRLKCSLAHVFLTELLCPMSIVSKVEKHSSVAGSKQMRMSEKMKRNKKKIIYFQQCTKICWSWKNVWHETEKMYKDAKQKINSFIVMQQQLLK